MYVCHSRETNFVSEKDWRVWEIPQQSTDDVMTLKAPCDVCDSSSDDSLTNRGLKCFHSTISYLLTMLGTLKKVIPKKAPGVRR